MNFPWLWFLETHPFVLRSTFAAAVVLPSPPCDTPEYTQSDPKAHASMSLTYTRCQVLRGKTKKGVGEENEQIVHMH